MLGYGRVLAVLGLSHGEIGSTYRLAPVVRYLVPRVLLAAIGFPFFAAGALVHYVPYKIPALVARSLATEPVERATIKLLDRARHLPSLLRARGSRRPASPFFSFSCPFSGSSRLIYFEAVSDLLREVRIFLWHQGSDQRRERLELWRSELVSELESRRRELETLEMQPSE